MVEVTLGPWLSPTTKLGAARVLALLLAAGGCVGSIEGGPRGHAPAGPAKSDDGDGTTVPAPGTHDPPGAGGAPALTPAGPGLCAEAAPAITPLRRLTREQYSATMRDLIGGTQAFGDALPEDGAADGLFDDPSSMVVTPSWAGASLDAAEKAAKLAVANLAGLVPCAPSAGDEACARQFIGSFGKRAFRRPLVPAEIAALVEIYKSGSVDGFAAGIEMTITAMLQAPSFLYRLELGQPAQGGANAGAVKLTAYEVAARLSYTLWGTMPDQPLMDAADAGKLATADQITAQARRLLADPRGHAAVVAFHQRWLELGNLDDVMKDAKKYPEYGPKLVVAMRAEVSALLEDVLFARDGRLETLLTTRTAFVDADLAPLYGVAAPAAGVQRVELPAAQRAGLLTNAGILTAHTFADGSAPIHRGKFVRERFLCTTPPPPPANLAAVAPDVPDNLTTREALATHRAAPSCAGCHELMDPIGLLFANYDGLGRWRTIEGGRPVDASGYIASSEDLDGQLTGVPALTARLAASAAVRGCMVDTLVGFAQSPDVAADSCVATKVRAAFEASGHDLREVIIAALATDGIQYRQLLAGEVLP